MAIVKMTKFQLFTSMPYRDKLLFALQEFSEVHFAKQVKKEAFFDKTESSNQMMQIKSEISRLMTNMQDIREELEIVNKELPMRQMKFKDLVRDGEKLELDPVLEKIEAKTREREHLYQDIQNAEAKKKEYMPWKNMKVPLKTLYDKKEVGIVLGTVRLVVKDKLLSKMKDLSLSHIEVISSDKTTAYLAAIYHMEEEKQMEECLKSHGFSEVFLEGEASPLEEIQRLEHRVDKIKKQIQTLSQSIKEIGKENLRDLELRYEYLQIQKLRLEAVEKGLHSSHVDIYEGYVPTNRKEEFEQTIMHVLGDEYYLTMEEARADDDQVPTKLSHNALTEQFKDLTSMYAVPKYNEIDPTPLLTPFYWVFFGMMAGDLGYGLVLLALTAYLWKSKKIMPNNKTFVKFLFMLSFSVIIWGILYGSFFGDLLKFPSLFTPAEDITTLIILSLIFGLVHLFFGLGIQAYIKIRDGHVKDAIFDVFFWYMTIGGAIGLLVGGALNFTDTGKTISKVVMILGMVGILLTGGRNSKKIGGKIAGGVYSLYNISGYVGDFVSYTRLMALGLAGGFIGLAVNMIVGMLWGGVIGKIFGVIVFIVFHAFNIFLSLLSAYVHSARLIYVEYFGKFYEGGGQAFQTLRAEPKYIRIKD